MTGEEYFRIVFYNAQCVLFLACCTAGLVPSPQTLGRSALPSVRSRQLAEPMVPELRSGRHRSTHVGDVVHPLHAHRTGVLRLQQSRRLHRQQAVVSVHKSTWGRTTQLTQRTRGLVYLTRHLEGRVRRTPQRRRPLTLGRNTDGHSRLLLMMRRCAPLVERCTFFVPFRVPHFICTFPWLHPAIQSRLCSLLTPIGSLDTRPRRGETSTRNCLEAMRHSRGSLTTGFFVIKRWDIEFRHWSLVHRWQLIDQTDAKARRIGLRDGWCEDMMTQHFKARLIWRASNEHARVQQLGMIVTFKVGAQRLGLVYSWGVRC